MHPRPAAFIQLLKLIFMLVMGIPLLAQVCALAKGGGGCFFYGSHVNMIPFVTLWSLPSTVMWMSSINTRAFT